MKPTQKELEVLQLPKFVSPQILIFCDLEPNAKFQNPTITPSGRKVMQAERKKKEKKRC